MVGGAKRRFGAWRRHCIDHTVNLTQVPTSLKPEHQSQPPNGHIVERLRGNQTSSLDGSKGDRQKSVDGAQSAIDIGNEQQQESAHFISERRHFGADAIDTTPSFLHFIYASHGRQLLMNLIRGQ